MFKRTKGAKSDVSELEYIASLHQTGVKLRHDCSISSTDVQLYLISRYGIKIEKKHANDIVLGLSGGGGGGGGDGDGNSNSSDSSTSRTKEVGNQQKSAAGFLVPIMTDEDDEGDDDDDDDDDEEQLVAAANDTNHNHDRQEGHNESNHDRTIMTGRNSSSLVRRRRMMLDKILLEKESNISSAATRGEIQQTPDKEEHSTPPAIAEEESTEQYMDLVQWVSSLFIPYFVEMKNASQQDNRTQRRIKRDLVEIHANLDELQRVKGQDITSCLSIGEKIMAWYKEKHLKRQAAILDSDLSFLLESETVLHCVYNIILRDLRERTYYGDTKNVNVILNEQTMNELLQFYGEMTGVEHGHEHNNYDDGGYTANSSYTREVLLKQMVECATEIVDRDGTTQRVYDFPSFVNALSSDVMLWDADGDGIEERLFCKDVVQVSCDISNNISGEVDDVCTRDGSALDESVIILSLTDIDLDLPTSNPNQKTNDETSAWKINCVSTAPYIDSVTDTQYSVLFVMVVWIYFIFSVSVYMTFINASAYDIILCDGSFQCTLMNRIWTWLCLGTILTFGGILIIIPISVANHPFNIGIIRASIATGAITVFTVVPYVSIKVYKDTAPHGENGEYTDLDRIVQEKWFQLAMDIYLSFGLLLLVFIIPKNFLSDHIYKKCVNHRAAAASHWVASSNVTRSAEIKMATRKKLHQLMQNAYDIHLCRGNKNLSDAYLGHEDEIDGSGGLIWTWSQLLSKRMIAEHGVWIHSRLAVGMEGQLITFGFLAWLLFSKTNDWANQAEEIRARIIAASESGPSKDFALWYIPTAKTIRDSSTVGIVAALSVGTVLILLYLPSAVATVLKLRCGVIPSMHDPHYLCYRLSADTTYYNTGNMIYGLIGTQILFFVFFGGITFLALWPVTSSGFLRFLAWFCALMITIILKFLVTKILRKKFFKAFFRQNPRAANIYSTAYEAWHLGLGGGVLIGRLTQFLLASAFWVGRIDVAFLCKDVHIFGYRFDTAPNNFRKDILVHEAHRHPYIDRLGLIYLMRLKHGNKFCSVAGCMWRRLFVLALMPWLQKYISIRKDISSSNHYHELAME